MLDSTKVINGAFCKVYHNGKWLTNANGLELQVEVNYEDVPRAGTRKLGKKGDDYRYVRHIDRLKN